MYNLFQKRKIKIIDIIYRYYIRLFYKKRIKLGSFVFFRKIPIIQLHKEAHIIIGDNVTINSDNCGYHVNMFAKCKLMADAANSSIHIGNNSRIHGCCIHAQSKIVIGNNCLIAANTQIMDCNGHSLCFDNPQDRIVKRDVPKPIIIEDNVWIGTGVIILPGCTIGFGSIITANSVVHTSIPPKVIAGGNPIKIIKSF